MASFKFWKTLAPNDQSNFPQQIGIDPAGTQPGDIYLAQSESSGSNYEDLTISRFVAPNYSYASMMTGLRGHGTPLKVENSGGTIYLTFPYHSSSGGEQWIRLPYIAGKNWGVSEALAYGTGALTENNPNPSKWFQGEAVFGDTIYRLYGGPFNSKGATKDGGPAVLQLIRKGKVVGTVNAAMLGRVGMTATGKPINGRLEPEGLTVGYIDGLANLVVGIANGYADNNTLRMSLYLYPLEVKAVKGPPPFKLGLLGAAFTPAEPAQIAQFTMVDTLTGQVLGAVFPNKWELSDPLTEPGTASLTIPFTDMSRDQLRELTLPRRRWLACQDANDNVVWCGPVARQPILSGDGEITVPLIDWRGYFWRTFLRPKSGVDNGPVNYKNTEQGVILRALLGKYWDGTVAPGSVDARPPFIWDETLDTNVNRDFSSAVLDKSIGELAQELSGRDRGIEWWTYGIAASDTNMAVRVGFAWPERRLRPQPILLEYRKDKGGNVADKPTWPEQDEAYTRVWAVGTGEPPAQPITKDQYPELKTGLDVLWETVLGPLDGVKKASTAYEYAYAAVQRSRIAGGQVELSILEEKLLPSSYAVGDRARVVFDDGWTVADVPAARIISRTITGGRGAPTLQRLLLDLNDAHAPGVGIDPGEAVGVDA